MEEKILLTPDSVGKIYERMDGDFYIVRWTFLNDMIFYRKWVEQKWWRKYLPLSREGKRYIKQNAQRKFLCYNVSKDHKRLGNFIVNETGNISSRYTNNIVREVKGKEADDILSAVGLSKVILTNEEGVMYGRY